MISVTAAIQQIAACRTSWGTESVPLEKSAGRVLAEAITADRDYPPFHRAARDGFAIRSSDVQTSRKQQFPLSHARYPGGELLPGHAMKVASGSLLPPDVDVVISLEEAEEQNGHVAFFDHNIRVYQHMRPRGEQAAAGKVLLEPGLRLNFQHLGLLASLGVMQVKVQRPPRVMFIAAGNELRIPGMPVNDLQLRDANGFTLTGLLMQYGIPLEESSIVPENAEAITSAIEQGLEADLLVICGNVPPKAVMDCGVEQVFNKVKAHPCNPFWFGYSPTRTRVMLMPGHPFAVQVACKLFVESYIRACWGIPVIRPWMIPYTEHRTAIYAQDEFIPAALVNRNGLKVKALSFAGQANLATTARADGMICHSAEAGSLEPSALVPFYPWIETA
ncbi:molybdopterin molybdotransferase MoeA [Chitinophaga sp. YIM B06452]|uniref:molybdopterin molybdotransferase MoeA n=1 Tax=Chitinophaga sp. YIM B06452 TaxID=3082158 RepID=UPI0031FF27E5